MTDALTEMTEGRDGLCAQRPTAPAVHQEL